VSWPRLLDLFCKAGGASRGYQQAGFYVVGVDIEPQPHYVGDEFYQADALEVLDVLLAGETWEGYVLSDFDAIHASPPCQRFSRMTNSRPGLADKYPDLIGPVRTLLEASGLPYVIENVPGAPIRRDVVLCGCQFRLRSPRGLSVRRVRWFEVRPLLFGLRPPCCHDEPALPVTGHSPGKEWREADTDRFGHAPRIDERRVAMGVPWMNRDEASEAVPPAYTEWIGRQLLEALERAA
jgi:DNA (cytosine-5)-methyltransferase 1